MKNVARGTSAPKRVLTPSDVVVGVRYRGGKIGRIRVVEKIMGFGWWVWCHWSSVETSSHCVDMDAFLKWATDKVETPAVVERNKKGK